MRAPFSEVGCFRLASSYGERAIPRYMMLPLPSAHSFFECPIQ